MSVTSMAPTPSDNVKMTTAPERTPMSVKKASTPSASSKPRKQKSDKNTVSLDI